MTALKVLVARAGKHGSTGDIAEAIVDVLRDAGHQADVRLAREVRRTTPPSSTTSS